MLKRILVLGGISLAVALAQYSTPAPNWKPPMTSWGEPDLQGIWPLDHLISVGLQRNANLGTKFLRTDEEMAQAKAALDARNNRFRSGAIPQADTSDKVMRQTSLIADPPDGQFPKLTPLGQSLSDQMKGSYKRGQTVFDGIEDFSPWDRCITRGMPTSMEPRNYNNGIRIVQSPGYVTVIVEMAHEARVIPTTPLPPLDPAIDQWMGESRGRWEGNTLVVETRNFKPLVGMTSAGVPSSPGPLIPNSGNMKITEKFWRVADNEIAYEMKVEDPEMLQSSMTIKYPMYLDNKYQIWEYACHEGNTAVRNYIETSRFERGVPGKRQ